MLQGSNIPTRIAKSWPKGARQHRLAESRTSDATLPLFLLMLSLAGAAISEPLSGSSVTVTAAAPGGPAPTPIIVNRTTCRVNISDSRCGYFFNANIQRPFMRCSTQLSIDRVGGLCAKALTSPTIFRRSAPDTSGSFQFTIDSQDSLEASSTLFFFKEAQNSGRLYRQLPDGVHEAFRCSISERLWLNPCGDGPDEEILSGTELCTCSSSGQVVGCNITRIRVDPPWVNTTGILNEPCAYQPMSRWTWVRTCCAADWVTVPIQPLPVSPVDPGVQP